MYEAKIPLDCALALGRGNEQTVHILSYNSVNIPSFKNLKNLKLNWSQEIIWNRLSTITCMIVDKVSGIIGITGIVRITPITTCYRTPLLHC